MAVTPTPAAATVVTPPADTDPFAAVFADLSSLKDDASSLAITAAMEGAAAHPTGPTGTVVPTDGPTGPTGTVAATEGATGAADDLASAAAAAAGEVLETATGPTGPTGSAVPAAVTGPTGAPASGNVDAKTFNELIAALKQGVAPPAAADVAQTPQPTPLTAEEAEAVNAFVTEFPQVAAAHQIIARRQLEATANYILSEVAAVVQPMLQRLELLGQRTHLGDLEAVVPDYGDVRQQVIDWVATQPPYLRTAYDSVIQQGSVDEVKDLIDRFRAATGKVVTPPAGATKPATELPTAAKKAATALAQVSSKRSTTTASTPSDFDGAFESFAKLE